jgi:hypothetical protein
MNLFIIFDRRKAVDPIVAFLTFDVCDSRRRIEVAVFEINYTTSLGFPEASSPWIA